MGLNTPKGPEKREERYDNKKKQQTPVEKVVDDTKKKVADTH